jgi:hypothetical protein
MPSRRVSRSIRFQVSNSVDEEVRAKRRLLSEEDAVDDWWVRDSGEF